MNVSIPGQTSNRKRRNTAPSINSTGDSSIIKYSALGTTALTDVTGQLASTRVYIPGNSNLLTLAIGPTIVANYSTGKFLPGTHIRWEPQVSFTTSGRVYCGFTDNPEFMELFQSTGSVTSRVNLIKGLGSMRSFPIWQETDIAFNTRMRRKMFDVNEIAGLATPDVLDRCMQTGFFYAIDGAPASAAAGSFWYHDVVAVEGIQPIIT